MGPATELEEQQMAREADFTAVPSIRWRAM